MKIESLRDLFEIELRYAYMTVSRSWPRRDCL
jgi:hypothetical protein